MKKSGNYYPLALLGAIFCGSPSVINLFLTTTLPDWVTIVALIIGIILIAAGAILGIKAKKDKE